MDGRRIPIDPDILLRESAWLHALARSLVGDPNTAEDVVQETWLAALRRPPHARERGQVRAFLATVVRRVAGATVRDANQRRLRERAASRPEAQTSEAEGLERLALQRELADALLTLREPYRTALVLRYVQGLAPPEIAVQIGISTEATRTRISRGLDLLRERLDHEHGGDRAAWSAVLLGLAHRGTGTGALVGAFVGGIVGLKLTLIAAATVVAAVALWTWSSTSGERSSALTDAAADHSPLVSEMSSGKPVDEVEKVAADAPRAPIAGSQSNARRLHGRIVSSLDHRPVPGAHIQIRTDDVAQRQMLEQHMRGSEAAIKAGKAEPDVGTSTSGPGAVREPAEILATCDAEGRFEMTVSAGGDRTLLATADTFVGRVVNERALLAGGNVEIELVPAGTLDVHVIDSANQGVAGMWLEVDPKSSLGAEGLLIDESMGGFGPSDAAGNVVIANLPVGVELSVKLLLCKGQSFHAAPQTALVDGEEKRGTVTIRVDGSGALRGKVLPIPSGDINAQARFTPLDGAPKPLVAKLSSDGSFSFERVPAGAGTLEIALIRRSERATTSSTDPLRLEIVAGETTDVGVIDVPSLVRLRGHVRGWDGATGDYFVELRFLREGRLLAHTVLDDEGRFEAWLPTGACVIEVVNQSRLLGSVPARAPDDDMELDLLGTCAGISGRLPVAFASTPMLFPHVESGDPSSPGWSPASTPQHAPFLIKDGAFRALPLEPGTVALFVPFGAQGTAWIPRVDLVRGQVTDVGELSIGFGTVRGHVVDAAMKPVGGADVFLSSPFEVVHTLALRRHGVADEHGVFEFAAVSAGPWQLTTTAQGGRIGGSPLVDVFPNADTEIEVALSAAAELDLRVSKHGEPQSGIELDLMQVDRPSPKFVDLADRDGRVERAGLSAGTWCWSIGSPTVLRTGTLTLKPGERRALDVDLAANLITCHLASPDSSISDAVAWSLDPARAGEMRRAKASRGDTFELDVDRGRWLIVMQVRRGGFGATRQMTSVVEIPSGAHALEVAASDIALALNRTGAAHDDTAPGADLVSIDGVPVESFGLRFTGQVSGGSVRYESLPPGSTVRLRGVIPPGGPIERFVAIPRSGEIDLEWK